MLLAMQIRADPCLVATKQSSFRYAAKRITWCTVVCTVVIGAVYAILIAELLFGNFLSEGEVENPKCVSQTRFFLSDGIRRRTYL